MAAKKSKSRKVRSTDKSIKRKTVRGYRESTAGKILPPLDVRTTKHLTDFEKRIKSGPLTIILVYADWCGHCHTMMPHFDAAAKSSNRSVQAIKVNEQMLENVNSTVNSSINKSAKPISVEGYPSIIVVDKKGNKVTDLEPVRNTETMTKVMNETGNIAANAGLVNSVKSVVENSKNIKNTSMIKNASIKNTKIANIGFEEKGLVSTKNQNSMNMDIGEDELKGSIIESTKNNINSNTQSNMNLNKLANKNKSISMYNIPKEAIAPSTSLTTFSNNVKSPIPEAKGDIKKEAEIITSLESPLLPPSANSDIETKNNMNMMNKKIGGGNRGGSLYGALARTSYALAPAAVLLATASIVMKKDKKTKQSKKYKISKKSKTYKKTKKSLKNRKLRK
jgi:thiol-disulfide isomerase/thioredoxin